MRHPRIALAAFVSLLLASTTTVVMAESSSIHPLRTNSAELIPAVSFDPVHNMHIAARRIQRERWYLHWLKRQHRIARRKAAERKALAAKEAATTSSSQTGSSSASGAAAGAPSGQLQGIAQCESGGSPTAVSPDGQYRGKYQFTYSTWAAMGGSGDPAAAPEAEQDARAAALMAQAGAGQWPVCGR